MRQDETHLEISLSSPSPTQRSLKCKIDNSSRRLKYLSITIFKARQQAYPKYVPLKNTTKESSKAFFPSTVKHKADDCWYSPRWLALRMVAGMDTVKFQELS